MNSIAPWTVGTTQATLVAEMSDFNTRRITLPNGDMINVGTWQVVVDSEGEAQYWWADIDGIHYEIYND